MEANEIERAIRDAIVKHINPREAYIFLFGSRASGEARPASDYDIGLYQGSEIPWKVMSRIQNELEEFPIPVDIELVDFSAVSDDFKKLALKNIRLWNKPEKNLTLI